MRSPILPALFLSFPILLAAGTGTVFAQGAPAAAAPAGPLAQASTPSQFIKTLADQALNSISGQRLSNDETTTRFRTLLRQSFDLKAIGRFVLGPYWNTASDAQKVDYQQAFENLIVDSYALRFRDYSGGTVKIGKEVTQGKDVSVMSQIVQANGAPPINVNWRVRPESDGFKIVDVAVEGVSMGQTQRSEFASVIEQNGGKIQPLIDAMKNHQVGLADTPAKQQ